MRMRPLAMCLALLLAVPGGGEARQADDEVTFDEEARIDGDMAIAWTPYNLFVDGEFRH